MWSTADPGHPGIDGIEAACRIVAGSPHIGVLVLTMFDDDECSPQSAPGHAANCSKAYYPASLSPGLDISGQLAKVQPQHRTGR
jgi:hypothetical protein